MTMTTVADARQGWLCVLRAELHRRLSSRRIVSSLITITVLAVLAGFGVLLFVREFDPTGAVGAAGSLPTAIEMTGGTAAILLGVHALALASTETRDGTVISSLLLVPNRRRLLAMRAAATVLVAAVAGVVATFVVLSLGVVLTGGIMASAALLAGCVLAAAMAVFLTALLGFLAGTLLRNGASGMVAAMVALIVLPLALAVAQLAAPPAFGPALSVLLAATPGAAIVQAVGVASAEPGELSTALTGVGILLIWVALIAVGARAQFRREGRNA